MRIKHIHKSTLLCPRCNGGAKQGIITYITDNVALTKKNPARDLYVIGKKLYRNTITFDDTPRVKSAIATLAL